MQALRRRLYKRLRMSAESAVTLWLFSEAFKSVRHANIYPPNYRQVNTNIQKEKNKLQNRLSHLGFTEKRPGQYEALVNPPLISFITGPLSNANQWFTQQPQGRA